MLTPEVLADVANANDKVRRHAEIGFLAFGEFVYSGDDPRATAEDVDGHPVARHHAEVPGQQARVAP